MSFTITTDVFCDGKDCAMWMEEGGVTSVRPQRRHAQKRAIYLGWKKLKGGKHLCPRCQKKRPR